MFATVCGVMMSLYMNNAGGAWDNAKKLVELGHYGGKNSDAHKATITGDTVAPLHLNLLNTRSYTHPLRWAIRLRTRPGLPCTCLSRCSPLSHWL
jgi:hypothetical protein